VSQEPALPATSYALLGLLSFGQELTGYEVKQWAESTLRFYWVAPAMSQVYSELGRLADRGLVAARDEPGAGRTVRRYRITDEGRAQLRDWLLEPADDFPLLKHPVALKLLLGHVTGAAAAGELLERYVDALAQRRAELAAVRSGIGDDATFAFPAMVAEWGLAYYDSEAAVVGRLRRQLEAGQ
jgi:DNA-binding PadR family transcriptional regulator